MGDPTTLAAEVVLACAQGILVGILCYFLQDQVDTLTFQSQSLRDRAQRFEEALRKNTEQQLEVVRALPAPLVTAPSILDSALVLGHSPSDSWPRPA